MKISLHAEFDSAEEYSAFVDMLIARPVNVRPFTTAAVIQELEATPKPKPEDKPQPPTEPDEPQPAAVVAEAPPAPAEAPVEAKKGRGRPRKAQPAETSAAAAAAPAATAPVQAPPAAANGPAMTESPREVLGNVFGAYVRRYGTGVGYTDVSKLLTENFGAGVRKQSDLNDEQLPKAIAVVSAAIESNPFQRRRADVQ